MTLFLIDFAYKWGVGYSSPVSLEVEERHFVVLQMLQVDCTNDNQATNMVRTTKSKASVNDRPHNF